MISQVSEIQHNTDASQLWKAEREAERTGQTNLWAGWGLSWSSGGAGNHMTNTVLDWRDNYFSFFPKKNQITAIILHLLCTSVVFAAPLYCIYNFKFLWFRMVVMLSFICGRMTQRGSRCRWMTHRVAAGPPVYLTWRTPLPTHCCPPCWSARPPRTWTAATPRTASRPATLICWAFTPHRMRSEFTHTREFTHKQNKVTAREYGRIKKESWVFNT